MSGYRIIKIHGREIIRIHFNSFHVNGLLLHSVKTWWDQRFSVIFSRYRKRHGLRMSVLHFNPFIPNAPFFYPLKTSENLTVFWCLMKYKKGALGKNCLNLIVFYLTLRCLCNICSNFLANHFKIFQGDI